MFVLIGAIGTTTAPTAHAAVGDVCDILGPYDGADIGAGVNAGDGDTEEGTGNKFLLEGEQYLFAILVSGGPTTVDISIQDGGNGDADIDYVAATNDDLGGGFESTGGGGVDVIDEAETQYANNDDLPAVIPWDNDFGEDLADWGFTLPDSPADSCADTGDDSWAFIIVDCDRAGRFEISAFVDPNDGELGRTENYECLDHPASMTLTAVPVTVESHPALGNISHSLLVATIVDSSGHYVGENYEVDWTTTGCKIDALTWSEYDTQNDLWKAYSSSNPSTAGAIELSNDGHGGLSAKSDDDAFMWKVRTGVYETRAAAMLHCEGEDPGTYTVTAQIEDDQFSSSQDDSDITATADVTVVGPAAFISMVAEPTELICGEKSQILVTVTDAIGQNVSDHTRVELITNYGGVLGGTGSSLGFPGVNPVNPLSSSAAETFGGVASAFLLTSTNHIGAYEVVAAAGGSNIGQYQVHLGYYGDDKEFGRYGYYYGNTGVFSTPVVTSQVTVTCSEAAPPEVVAPDTGTGTISPPNTGDAGLATSSAGAATLFVIFGAVAFVLAGFASFGFARR